MNATLGIDLVKYLMSSLSELSTQVCGWTAERC